MTPEQHQQPITQASHGLMREAAQKLDQATDETQHERRQLAGLIGTTRKRDEQHNWLIYTGVSLVELADQMEQQGSTRLTGLRTLRR